MEYCIDTCTATGNLGGVLLQVMQVELTEQIRATRYCLRKGLQMQPKSSPSLSRVSTATIRSPSIPRVQSNVECTSEKIKCRHFPARQVHWPRSRLAGCVSIVLRRARDLKEDAGRKVNGGFSTICRIPIAAWRLSLTPSVRQRESLL